MNKYIAFIFCALILQYSTAQEVTKIIKGNITDKNNKPIENVSISIKGTTVGTVTNIVGFFSIRSIRPSVILVISNLGYNTQEININTSKSKNVHLKIQLSPTTYQLEEVRVTSNPSSIESSVIDATKRHASIPGGTNIVSMKSINNQRSLTLKDALNLQPGIIIQEFFGANDQPRLNIRGSGIQSNPQFRGINLLQDGISTNFADGSYIIGTLEPRAANYIEVYRGANALRYGTATLGGAVNLISKNGYNAAPLSINLEGGSFGYLGGSISTGLNDGKNDLYSSLSYSKAAGYRTFNSSEKINGLLNIGRRFSEQLESRIYVNYSRLKFDIPGPLTQAQMDDDPTQISLGIHPPTSIGPNVLRDKPRRFTDILRVANKTVYSINNARKLTVDLYYQYGDDTFVFPIVGGIRHTLSNDLGMHVSYQHKTANHAFSTGLNFSTGKMNRFYFANIKGARGKNYAHNNLSATNLAFFIEDIYKLTPKLEAIISAQLSSNSRNNTDKYPHISPRPFFNFKTKKYGTFAATNTSLNQNFVGINPQLGFIYTRKQAQFFANMSQSYEPPTFDELINQSKGNPNKGAASFKSVKLDAQTATTAELGSRGTIARVHWDICFYHSWVKNEILTTTDLFGITGKTRNSPDQTIHQGLEVGLNLVLLKNIISKTGDHIDLHTVYNYSNFYFNEGIYKDHQIAGIPKHYIASALEYTHPSGAYLAMNLEYLPEKTPTDHQNTVFQKSYQLLGFKAGFSHQNWGVFIEGKNITDQTYASSYLIRDVVTNPPPPALTPANVTTFIPGVGINFTLGVHYKI